jgi:dUTPase
MIIRLTKQNNNPDIQLPQQQCGNVGFDIRAIEAVSIPHNGVAKINTGICLADNTPEINVDCQERDVEECGDPNESGEYPTRTSQFVFTSYFKIEGRSGLAAAGIWPVGGIIDPNYRGPITVILHNSTTQDYQINVGDRIAQLVLYPVVANSYYENIDFEWVEEQTFSNRNQKGFGASGR